METTMNTKQQGFKYILLARYMGEYRPSVCNRYKTLTEAEAGEAKYKARHGVVEVILTRIV